MPAIIAFQGMREDGRSMELYLVKFAIEDEKEGLARTYLVKDRETGEIVCFFSLKAGMISINDTGRKLFGKNESFGTVPGMELSHLAMNGAYVREHQQAKGLFVDIFDSFIIPIVKAAQEMIGLRYLYVFAINRESLIEYYKMLGFRRLKPEDEEKLNIRIRPHYNKDCIFMFMKI